MIICRMLIAKKMSCNTIFRQWYHWGETTESVLPSQEMQEKISSLGKEVGNATGKPFVCQPELQAAILSPKYPLALLGLR